MQKLRRHRQRFKGLSVGLDLHNQYTQVSVLDEAGDECRVERIVSQPQLLGRLIDQLTAAGSAVQVALEASGCFLWAYDWLVGRLGREHVHVAAPSKVRVIAQSQEKTDANDAWWLAYLLWEGRLPQAFVAEGDLRELRIASRELRSVIDQRSDLMRQMRSHLRQLGLTFAKRDWASVIGHHRIADLVAQTEATHGTRGQVIARLWTRIEQMDQQVAHWRDQVKAWSSKFDQIRLMQQQLPGVGPTIAAAVFAELGDPARYRSAKAYAKATGLTPGYRESGGRRSKLHITRAGSTHVRWALTRAVLACMRCRQGPGLAVQRWVERRSRRQAKKAAMVAAARKLAEGVWRLFAWGETFDLARAFGPPYPKLNV